MDISEIVTMLFGLLFLLMMIVLELIKGKSLKSLFDFSNKYLPCLWLSLITCLLFYSIRQVGGPVSSLCLRTITLLLLVVSEYLLAVYMLFRGMFVLFTISKEGLQHPTITAVKKLTKNRVTAFLYITFLILLFNISNIYTLYSDWVSM
jgi:hypothetical protein